VTTCLSLHESSLRVDQPPSYLYHVVAAAAAAAAAVVPSVDPRRRYGNRKQVREHAANQCVSKAGLPARRLGC